MLRQANLSAHARLCKEAICWLSDRRSLHATLAGRTVLPLDQANPPNPALPRNLAERRAYPNRLRSHRLPAAAVGATNRQSRQQPTRLRAPRARQLMHTRPLNRLLAAPDPIIRDQRQIAFNFPQIQAGQPWVKREDPCRNDDDVQGGAGPGIRPSGVDKFFPISAGFRLYQRFFGAISMSWRNLEKTFHPHPLRLPHNPRQFLPAGNTGHDGDCVWEEPAPRGRANVAFSPGRLGCSPWRTR
jgi:hypothetical protein